MLYKNGLLCFNMQEVLSNQKHYGLNTIHRLETGDIDRDINTRHTARS